MDDASLVCSISGGLFVLVEDPRMKPVQGPERVPLILAIKLEVTSLTRQQYRSFLSPVHYYSVLWISLQLVQSKRVVYSQGHFCNVLKSAWAFLGLVTPDLKGHQCKCGWV